MRYKTGCIKNEERNLQLNVYRTIKRRNTYYGSIISWYCQVFFLAIKCSLLLASLKLMSKQIKTKQLYYGTEAKITGH